MRLSVTVIALNQEAKLGPCLSSVSIADEIVLVDTGSTDGTLEVARRYTDRIFTTTWQGFGRTKNFALDQARGDWVLSLDTDERVPPALQEEILAVVQADGPLAGYRVPRKNYVGDHWVRHLGWYPDYTLRLFRRGQGRFRDREVHEEVLVDGPVGFLTTPLEHYSYNNWPPARSSSRWAGSAPRRRWPRWRCCWLETVTSPARPSTSTAAGI